MSRGAHGQCRVSPEHSPERRSQFSTGRSWSSAPVHPSLGFISFSCIFFSETIGSLGATLRSGASPRAREALRSARAARRRRLGYRRRRFQPSPPRPVPMATQSPEPEPKRPRKADLAERLASAKDPWALRTKVRPPPPEGAQPPARESGRRLRAWLLRPRPGTRPDAGRGPLAGFSRCSLCSAGQKPGESRTGRGLRLHVAKQLRKRRKRFALEREATVGCYNSGPWRTSTNRI